MSVRETVFRCLRETLEEGTRIAGAVRIDEATELDDFRLDSLAFGELLARLEDALGHDPLAGILEVDLPRTVGDLVRLCDGRPAG